MSRRYFDKMGNAVSRVHPKKEFPVRELFKSPDSTGYVLFSNLDVNADVLTMILSHLSAKDVLNCRLVCKNWTDLIDTDVWRSKIFAIGLGNNLRIRSLHWCYLFMILNGHFLNQNMIKNPHGVEGLKHWSVLASGGNKWTYQSPPAGADEPYPHISCFATSFNTCLKEQVIDLFECGVLGSFMDNVRPDVVVSEWYAGRWDCRAIYEMQVNLINESSEIVDEFRVRERCGGDNGSDWRQVSHTFKNYSEGVRYIRFLHGGVDEQFWAGHYGSKMTGANVQLTISCHST